MSTNIYGRVLFVGLILVLAACTDSKRPDRKVQGVDNEPPTPSSTSDTVTLDVEMDGMFALVGAEVEQSKVVWALMPRLDQTLDEEAEAVQAEQTQPRDIPNTMRSLPQHYGFVKLDAKNLAPGDNCWEAGEEGAGSAPVLLSLSARDPRSRYPDLADMLGHEIEFEAAFLESTADINDPQKMFPDVLELDPERAQVVPEFLGDKANVDVTRLVGRVLFRHGEVVPRAEQDGPWVFAHYGAQRSVHGNHVRPCMEHARDCAEVLELASLEPRAKLAGRAGIQLRYPRGPLKLHLRPFGEGEARLLTLCPAGNENKIEVAIINLSADDLLRKRGDSHRLTENRIEHFLAYYNLSRSPGLPSRRLFPLRMIGTSESGGIAAATGTGGDPYCSIVKMSSKGVNQ
jgi:hypothetical protein